MNNNRIDDLEIKISFLERQLEELNRVVAEQQRVIECLCKDDKQMKELINELANGEGITNPPPPHH
jgi:uncharacterized coiled-coil protein SlyX